MEYLPARDMTDFHSSKQERHNLFPAYTALNRADNTM